VVVSDLTERTNYDAEEDGFTILVTDTGDGRAAIYAKLSDDPGDWSDPAFIVGDRFDLSIFVGEYPHSGEAVLRHVFSEASILFQAGLVDSSGSADDPASSPAVFTIQKNGADIGSVTFTGFNATFSLPGGAHFEKGDTLHVIAPTPQDPTLFNVSITLAGVRSP
jgi:hypothetical protein